MLCAFDSNQDKIFDKQDVEFNNFLVWQDKNQNGKSEDGELLSPNEVGFAFIDFNTQQPIEDPILRELGALNIADVFWEDGRITKAYDLVFLYQ